MKMNADYTPRSGGKSRRGPRRGGNFRGSRPDRYGRSSKATEPAGFFGKIVAFFKKPFAKKTVRPSFSRSAESRGTATENRFPVHPSAPAASKPEIEPPNPDAVTAPRLYVGNLSYDTGESDLFDLFSKVGSVKNVELIMDRRANRSKGFGFVEMNDIDVAKQAVMKLHRTEFMGRQIMVSGAKSDRREG